ncbi:hypothetical protein BKA65DRAFT_262214 [Rhexocercosporidium sp. MPI-PUGE-AT-0058]|nr:hypothetical protein BKA65DRAFT_262214 [Rhexocercosporidium sp. MPI-PUGE-AT-0058]
MQDQGRGVSPARIVMFDVMNAFHTRNCIRLGRKCSYTTRSSSPDSNSQYLNSSSGPPTGIEEPETSLWPRAYTAASQQAWLARNSPSDFEILYSVPHQQNLSPLDVTVVQESRTMMLQRSMSRDMMMTIAQHYKPKYNLLAARFGCVKHAVVGLGAYTHFHVTRSPVANDVCVRHRGLALRALQKEINNFGPSNCDAVVTSSIFLSATADSWEEWAVYVDGYSKAITHIINNQFHTAYPGLLSDDLQLRRCAQRSNPHTNPLPKDVPVMKSNIVDLIHFIVSTTNFIGLPKWRAAGFEELEKLACSASDAMSEVDEIERYHLLSGLRSWLFWTDMRKTNGSAEQTVLTAHFYGLVLAVMPVFPARYVEILVEICAEKITKAQRALDEENDELGLGHLLNLAQSYMQS